MHFSNKPFRYHIFPEPKLLCFQQCYLKYKDMSSIAYLKEKRRKQIQVKRDKGNEEIVAGIGIQNQQFLVSFQRAFDKSVDFYVSLTEKLAIFSTKRKRTIRKI